MSTTVYPVRVEAHLEPGLSRWLWLIKWFLAIPHYLVLAVLWAAFAVLSVVAFFSILFTGRYPRSIFAFNVGVLRWTWRVSYYAYGALGTDRYPPFTLEDVPDYPAHLDVAYPDQLSRGLVLVKWWLLAIPHYIIVGLLTAGLYVGRDVWFSGGVITVLVLVAALVLLFSGRYPQPLFDLILGLNRWVLRVAAYAGLMTDEYPPFRFDAGGDEPHTVTVPAPTRQAEREVAAEPRPGHRPGWTGGRVVSVVFGALLILAATGLLAGGGAALWADRVARDDAGFVTSGLERLTTDTYALTTEDLQIHVGGTGVAGTLLGDLRLRVTPGDPTDRIFVGIAPTSSVDAYLGDVEHAIVQDFPARARTRVTSGGAPRGEPARETFWVETAAGTGTQTIDWTIRSGSWTLVAMNEDASRGIDLEADVGATFPALPWFALGLLVGGGVFLLAGITLVVIPIRRAGAHPATPAHA